MNDDQKVDGLREVTEDTFINALECLPPLDWQGSENYESFKMCEFYDWDTTNIYVRIKHNNINRYFSFTGLSTLTHDEIVEIVLNSEKFKQSL